MQSMGQKLTGQTTIRFTPEDLERLHDEAKKLSMEFGEFMRRRALRTDPPASNDAPTKEIDGHHAVAVPLRAVNVSAGHGTAFEEPSEPRFYFFRSDFFIRITGRGVPPRDRFMTVFLSPLERLDPELEALRESLERAGRKR